MAGSPDEQLRQLQALMQTTMQTQTESIGALAESVQQVSMGMAGLTQDMAAMQTKLTKMLEEFDSRIKLLEERGSYTSPPRNTSRVDDGDEDMGTNKTGGQGALHHSDACAWRDDTAAGIIRARIIGSG